MFEVCQTRPARATQKDASLQSELGTLNAGLLEDVAYRPDLYLDGRSPLTSKGDK